MEAKRVNLYKTEGSSDKVYNVELKELDGAWAVHAYNGRRGKALRLQNKGEGLDYEAASKIYDKVVKSKIKGGYTEHEDGVSYSSSEFAGDKTEFKAQLLNEITLEEALELGEEWLVQEKHDGERRGAYEGPSGPVYANRTGLAVSVESGIDEAFRSLLAASAPGLGLDAEDMGLHLEVFDITNHPMVPKNASFAERARYLESLQDLAREIGVHDKIRFNVPVPAPVFFATRLEELQGRNAEGFVLRHRDSAYTPGKPASGGEALKVKFWDDITCRVGDSRAGKRSVGLELLDDEGNWTPVGNVTIPANADIPEKGSLIDVKYLYAYKGGSIYQPTFKAVRTDVEPQECTMSRLKYKPEPATPAPASSEAMDGPGL
jgi:bifunctional non-homologous end joining protein LigD